MKLGRWVAVASFGCFLSIVGCGDDSDGDGGSGSLDHAVPDEACFYCCLDNGYMSAGYTNFGGEECTCIAP